ncbi:toxin YdaT family protein [Serratia fonticola]|uniref:toxin YdaT family protein n=1 Tax=Serratia fonticola TaxID=47917 RepID=UPI00217C5D05|nr:toxin YdaT family protein [Serratia fonticola]CAI1688246.1 Protein of uncharacterised function (DUF1019) [Serratia fonticola]
MEFKHEELRAELEGWAAKAGWKLVTEKITAQHVASRGVLLKSLDGIEDADDFDRALGYNKLFIQRSFREDSAVYRQKARSLTAAVLAALPAESREKLINPKSVNYLAAVAIRDFSLAITAVLLGCCDATQKLNRVNEAVHALIPITQQLIS